MMRQANFVFYHAVSNVRRDESVERVELAVAVLVAVVAVVAVLDGVHEGVGVGDWVEEEAVVIVIDVAVLDGVNEDVVLQLSLWTSC